MRANSLSGRQGTGSAGQDLIDRLGIQKGERDDADKRKRNKMGGLGWFYAGSFWMASDRYLAFLSGQFMGGIGILDCIFLEGDSRLECAVEKNGYTTWIWHKKQY